MFVQGFGEVLTDILTVNPALADLPSVSSILDTSNYTFQAVTFGKDAGGFVQHAHAVSSTQYVDGESVSGASSYDSGFLNIINYGSDVASGASSYVVSATYGQFISTYNSVPNDPSPLDTRLERGSTLSTNLSDYQYASALPDSGHYANAILDSQLSAIWNKVGAYAPSGGAIYKLHDKDENLVYSSIVSGVFNKDAIIDKDGFIRVSPSSVSQLQGLSLLSNSNHELGSLVLSSASLGIGPPSGTLAISNRAASGDAVTLVSFGSVKHVGVYCLDLKSMLSSGLIPPFDYDALNNNRKYKLVAKATILDNPLFHRDLVLPGLANWLGTQDTIIALTLDFK